MQAALTSRKSKFEQLRKPVSFAVSAALLFLIVSTKSAQFETVPYKVLNLLGLVLIFAGVAGRIWCTLYIAGRKNRVLCTTGPYQMCRNPLYLFSFIGFVGICLAAQSTLLTLIAAAAFLAYYHEVIRSEERRLAALFPEEFPRYVQTTPRFWPKLAIPDNSQILQVDSKLFTRSLLETFWFLLAIIPVEIIEDLKSGHIIGTFILPF